MEISFEKNCVFIACFKKVPGSISFFTYSMQNTNDQYGTGTYKSSTVPYVLSPKQQYGMHKKCKF